MHSKNIITSGKPVSEASKVLIMLHGRNSTADDIISLSHYLIIEDFAVMAPQAINRSWYPYSFLSPPEQNEPWLTSALDLLTIIVKELNEQNISSDNIFFLGFSQGACLTLEFAARNAVKYGGISAFTGALIGDKIYRENYKGDFQQTPVFIGTSDPDPHVPLERVQATAGILKQMNANLSLKIYQNLGHKISQDEINEINSFIFSKL